MKKILLVTLFLTYSSLFALTIVLNSAKEKKENYAILHIFSKTAFKCTKKVINIKQNNYICTIDGSSRIDIKPKRTKFIDIFITKKSNKTKITLVPKYNIKIFKTSPPLYQTKQIQKNIYSKAKHWIFLLYKKNTFLRTDPKDIGIKFPVYFNKSLLPNIGALDLNGIPISYVDDSKDIQAYLSVKQDYDKQRYKFVVSEVDKALKNFPNSIFADDFLLYKMRSIQNLISTGDNDPKIQDLDNNKVIKIGRKWIKEFPSNQNIPEVLYCIAKAYQNLGQDSDAKYFFDILVTEHPKNKYTKMGILAFADNLYSQNQKQKALKLYKDVLYSAKNIQVASEAANRLANIYLSIKNIKKAREYYIKILNANPNFFLKNTAKAYDLAMKFNANNMTNLSIKLLKQLLNKAKRNPDLRGNILKSLGDEFAKLKNYKSASKYYKQYLKSFRYGQYSDEVKKSLDGLFFNISETNSTKLLQYYNKLMKRYNSGKIYQKAGILKAKVLIKEKKYIQSITFLNNFKYNLENKKNILQLKEVAAEHIVTSNLDDDNCSKAIEFLVNYKPKIHQKYDKKLSKCFIDTNNYGKALNLAENRLKDVNLKPKDKVFWLKILAKSLYKKQEFAKLLTLSNDVLSLGETYNVKNYQNILYYKFLALFGLKKYDDALKVADKIEKVLKNSFKNIEIYQKLINYAKQTDDSLMIVKYAKDIIGLQNRYKSYVLTPEVELSCIGALKKLNQYKNAKNIAKELLSRVVEKDIKARVLYEIGEISLKLNDIKGARESFKKCSDLNITNGWKNLCKESLKIL